MKQKLFSILALLLMAATGAWAQTETLLTTIKPTGQTTFSETTSGVVTVTHDNNDFSADYGWLWDSQSGSLTVEAKEGYTITRCVFKQNSKTPATITSSPFAITFGDDGTCEQCDEFMDGVTSIEVYGYAPAPAASTYSVTLAEGTEDGDKWTISPTEAAEGAKVTATYKGEKKVKSVKAVKKEAPADPLAVPMTIEAITAGSITVSNPKAGMQYSLDGGATKNAVTTDEIVLNAGDKVQFYGNGTSITSYKGTSINGSGNGFTCKVYGNIMSLVDEENFATATTLSENYTFSSLFSEFITLTDASGLLLPATQLAVGCYNSMFYGCTALTAAPALTATQLASGCYQQMFRGCARLTTAPELPATQLAASCYLQMFQGCASLTTAPGLPATQLATACYQQMFMGCTALTASPMLPAETLVTSCYRQMFYQCSKLATVTCLATSGINQSNTNYWLVGAGSQAEDTRTVYTVSTANWPTGNNGIPNNWTRVDVDN